MNLLQLDIPRSGARERSGRRDAVAVKYTDRLDLSWAGAVYNSPVSFRAELT